MHCRILPVCQNGFWQNIDEWKGGKTDGTDSRRVRREHYHASCWWRCHQYTYVYCDTGIVGISRFTYIATLV